MNSRKLTLSIILLCAISAWQFGSVAYLHVKARLAQYLVAEAWTKVKQGEAKAKPWPWADTWPVAQLRVPRYQVEQWVLAGASGRTLAFGPGWMKASAELGSAGVVVLAGHRDTHFGFLAELAIGDVIEIDAVNGPMQYQVDSMDVVDSTVYQLSLHATESVLVLITCYPFDGIDPGTPLRYVVSASRILETNT